MFQGGTVGQIVILNGTPRSGKSSIATMIQNMFEGVWMNLGVDRFKQMTPQRYQPGIGLRPGGERPDLEPLIVILYRAMYETIALHSRLGLDTVHKDPCLIYWHHESRRTNSVLRRPTETGPGAIA